MRTRRTRPARGTQHRAAQRHPSAPATPHARVTPHRQRTRPAIVSQLEDYIAVSYTNAAAFSPTDTKPLTRLAKRRMINRVGRLSLTVPLIAGRAANIMR